MANVERREHWAARLIRKYIEDTLPKGTIFKTNKAYDKGAAIVRANGKIFASAKSNAKLVNALTTPGAEENMEKEIPPLLDIPPQYNIKNYSEKKMTEALSHAIESIEFSGEKNPRFICDKNGVPMKIRTDVAEYNLKGRRRQRG